MRHDWIGFEPSGKEIRVYKSGSVISAGIFVATKVGVENIHF